MADNFGSGSEMYTDSSDTHGIGCSSLDNMSEIMRQLTKLLELDENDTEKSSEIVKSLLQNGRQSLISYENDLIGEIYEEQMKGGSELLQFLKQYHGEKWETQYATKFSWFKSLIEETEKDAKEILDCVLTRTAEYGEKYMNNCPLLSIVIQILFESLTDDDMASAFKNIWNTLTNEGLQSITQHSNYIVEEIMNKQMEKIDQKLHRPLFMALREYYRKELFEHLQESKIVNRANLYELTLDLVAEYGWVNGLMKIEKKTTKTNFDRLKEFITQRQNSVPTPVPTPTPAQKPAEPTTMFGNVTLDEKAKIDCILNICVSI